MSDGREWTLRLEERVPLVNEQTEHWGARSRLRKHWREQAGWAYLIAKVPELDAVEVTFRVHRSGKAKLPDPDSCQCVSKPVLDALADVGVLANDSGTHVRKVSYLPAVRGDDALEIVISEVVCGGV